MTLAVGAKAGKTPRWKCKQCGERFDRNKEGSRTFKFCAPQCYKLWQKSHRNAGHFKTGHRVWNKGVKGLHLSPHSEYKKGRKSEKWLPVGSETIRTRKRDNKPRCFIKIAEPNVWKLRAVLVWEKRNGPLPRGLLIHHEDRDTLNDKIRNLKALTRAEHIREHHDELLEAKGIR